jgi:predicted DNA-binding protein
MATSPIIGVRLDPETIERLDEAAELRGHTRASLARHWIKQQLVDNGDHEPPIEGRFPPISRR